MFLFISHVEDPEQFQITTNLKTQRDPAIYRDFVVWEDKRNGNYDIYGYNFSANEEFQLTSDPRGQVLQREPFIIADQIKNIDRRIAGFEVINNAGFETENLFGRLINEDEIKRRLEFLSDRTLEVAREILSEQMRQE
jgi:beta propeller repeat protein